MAENDEAEKGLNPGDKKTNVAADNADATAPKVAETKVTKKKVTKKRAARKKVVKKRAATKKVVTKKAFAVEAAPSAYKEGVQETGQRAVETGGEEEGSEPGSSVVSREPSDTAVKGGIKEEIPAPTRPSELPREEKVTMSVDVSKTTGLGFLPKVILWVVVVLAAFMYIRSLAHKGQPAKHSEGSAAPAVMNETRLEAHTTSIEASRSPASDTAISQSTKSEISSVGKVGEVAIGKVTETKMSSAESESSSAVSVTSSQAEEGAEKAAASAGQQVTIEPERAVQKDVSPTVAAGLVSIQANDSEKEPAASTATTGSVQTPVSAATAADQVVGHMPGDTAESQTQAVDEPSGIAAGSGPEATPSAAVNERSAADEERRKAAFQANSPAALATAAVAEDSADAAPVAADTVPSSEASTVDVVTASTADLQQRKRPEFGRDSGRPSFKELFGYERPKPPVGWQDRGSYEPFAPDNFDQQQGFYPAPWPYAPRQPAWGGGEYPSQYGPYGNYGGAYPAYPGMPGWAPYQPYGYGSGY